MITSVTFPKPPGTTVTLSCDQGYSLSGAEVVTCVKDDEFHFPGSETPKCLIGLFFFFNFTFGETNFTSFFSSFTQAYRSDATSSKDTILHKISDQCSALPYISHLLSPNTQFPVNYNTLVTVTCQTGASLQGDDVITCLQGRRFRFGTQPTCVPSESLQ